MHTVTYLKILCSFILLMSSSILIKKLQGMLARLISIIVIQQEEIERLSTKQRRQSSQIIEQTVGQKMLLTMTNAMFSHEMSNPINSIYSLNIRLKYLGERLAEII